MQLRYLYALFPTGILIVGLLFLWWEYRKRVFDPRSLSLVLLRIRLAKKDKPEERGADPIKEIAFSEQLFASLASIDMPISLEIAVHSVGEAINFYAVVPREKADFVMRQIQGLVPNAQVDQVERYSLFEDESASAGVSIDLARHYSLPIRSYIESGVDTFAPVVSTLSKLSEKGEGAVLQIVMMPASKKAKGAVLSALGDLKKGKTLKEIFGEKKIFEEVGDMVFKGGKDEEKEKQVHVDEDAVKALQSKVSKPLFAVNIRILAGAPTADRAEDIVLSVASAFRQFDAPLRNSLVFKKIKKIGKLVTQYTFRQFDQFDAMILNTEEIASLFHLPVATTDVPRIQWLKNREVTPPPNLPEQGVTLGENHFRGETRQVRMTDEDRRRHLYVIGQTGTGKSSTILAPLAVQDMQRGKGVCVIDPHGELIDDILALVPKNRIDDVIVFDPGDVKRPLSLNMLEYNLDNPEEKTFIVNEFIGIFDRLYDLKATGGPQFEQFLRYSLLLLMEDAANDPPTLMEVPRIFTDEKYRKTKLARIKSPNVIDFWEKEAVKTTGEAGLANMTPYITSKFNSFIANDYIRPIIAQPKSSFNFRDVMDNNKILLVSLSKGKIGDLNASLLGMVITGRILMAALGRANLPPEQRNDFYFYIDEFQNFTTDSISTILSEARKYKLNLILAHQFIGQLTDEIRTAVFGNVGSMVAFRVGNPDEEAFVKIFGPEFTERDLISQDNFHAIGRLLIGGQPTRPFNFKANHMPRGSREVANKLKELSRLVYGRDIREIEADIYDRLRKEI